MSGRVLPAFSTDAIGSGKGMASRPKPPEVPLELWRRALEAALAFRTLAPWEWMNDSEIAAVVDAGGRPWFASVLGAAGQVYGLALYRGAAGLRVVQQLMAARGPEDWEELRFAQDGLTVWFGPKSELRKEDRERYAALGYQPVRGARLAWPSFLDHRPGFVAWPPDADDLSWMVEVIPAVRCLAEILRDHPGLFEDRGQFEFPLISLKKLFANPDGLEWRHWELGPERESAKTVQIDDPTISARLKELPVSPSASLDVDWSYHPEGVVDGGRPFYPRDLQVFEARSGACLAFELTGPADDIVERTANRLAGLMIQSGGIPLVVRVRRPA